MPIVRYFAYGSNLSTALLQYRCPSAVAFTVARAPGYAVAFGKLGRDETGKATLVPGDGRAAALGAVFALERADLDALDAWEGDGYRRAANFKVECLRTGAMLVTETYIAKRIRSDLAPYDWYLAIVLAGLAEHGLDPEYASRLRESPYLDDTVLGRQTRQETLRALAQAGVTDYRVLLAGRSR